MAGEIIKKNRIKNRIKQKGGGDGGGCVELRDAWEIIKKKYMKKRLKKRRRGRRRMRAIASGCGDHNRFS